MVNVSRFFFSSVPLFFPSPFILMPPCGTKRTNKIQNLLHKQSPTDFFFFFFHATSWHMAKFHDTPLYRSSTDFPFFYATLWHRAEVPDTLLNWSLTDHIKTSHLTCEKQTLFDGPSKHRRKIST